MRRMIPNNYAIVKNGRLGCIVEEAGKFTCGATAGLNNKVVIDNITKVDYVAGPNAWTPQGDGWTP